VDDAGVLLKRFVDADSIICQVERDNEASVLVLGDTCVEPSCESKDLLVVVKCLELINFRTMRHQSLDVSERVTFASHQIRVGRHFLSASIPWEWWVVSTEREMSAVSFGIVGLSVLIDSEDLEQVAETVDFRIWHDLVACQVVVADESLTRLLDIVGLGELPPCEELGERVISIILSVHFEYLHGVVSQEVRYDEGPALEFTVEAKYFSVVVKELFLRLNFASSELFLHVVKHLRVLFGENGNLRFHEVVNGAGILRLRLRS
jgi:hypothetical protein